MDFDKEGQAATEEEKIHIHKRSYDILMDGTRFPPEDIVFDLDVLMIGTGIYQLDFME